MEIVVARVPVGRGVNPVPEVLQPLRVQRVFSLVAAAGGVGVVGLVPGVVVLLLVHLLVPRGAVRAVASPAGIGRGGRAAERERVIG